MKGKAKEDDEVSPSSISLQAPCPSPTRNHQDPEKAAKKAEKAQKVRPLWFRLSARSLILFHHQDQEKAEKKAVRELKAKEKKDKEDKAAEVKLSLPPVHPSRSAR